MSDATFNIRGVRATPVRVTRRPELLPRTAHGEVSASDYVLLELETEDGVTGIGEVTCSPRWNGEEWAGTALLVREAIDPVLRGADLRSWAATAASLDRAVRGRPFLRAGVEMAFLDALGKTVGVPVATLLGGAVRTELPTKVVLPAREPGRVAEMAETALANGARTLKVKVGTGLEGDLDRVATVRELAGEGVPITVDANEGWDADEAGRAIAGMRELGVAAVEQPLTRRAWNRSALLRHATGPLLVADESVWTLADVLRSAEERAFDVVSVYPGKCGGMLEAVAIARVATELGLGVSYGSNLELGVGAAAMAHSIAATGALSPDVPADLIGPLYFEHSLITDHGFVRWDGATLPDGPGLGVELDRDAVERHRLAA